MNSRSTSRTVVLHIISTLLVGVLLWMIFHHIHTNDLHLLQTDPNAYLVKQRKVVMRGSAHQVWAWIFMSVLVVGLYEALNFGFRRLRFAPRLERAFVSRGITRGGILMLRPAVAMELVDRARSMNLRVVGLDAFTLDANHTEPRAEDSIDLTQTSSVDLDCWATANAFLFERMQSDLYFEVVLE